MRAWLWGLLTVAVMATPACKKDKDNKGDTPAKDEPAGKDTTDTTETPPESTDSKLVERGKYLSDLMGCALCHTPFGERGLDTNKLFAGGLEVTEKFGTWRSPNITQDEATGIGTWTDEQIIAAIREGKRSNGEQLYMIMPFPYYHKMSDEDAKALVAFLRTIKPIENKVERAKDLKLPPVEVPPATGEAPNMDDPAAYGEYLTSLMHCEMCHTPMTKEGGPDMKMRYAGGFEFEMPPEFGEGKVYSANITQDKKTGLGDWTDAEIEAAIREMKSKDGSVLLPPMAMYQQAWLNIDDDDMKAIVAFLRTLPAIENKVPESTFKPAGPPPGAGGDDKGGEEEGDEEEGDEEEGDE